MYYLAEKKSIGPWWNYGNRKESVDKAFVYALGVGFRSLTHDELPSTGGSVNENTAPEGRLGSAQRRPP